MLGQSSGLEKRKVANDKVYFMFSPVILNTWSQQGILECLPVLSGHEVVDNGIDGGAEVEEDAGDVEHLLIDGIEQFIRDKVPSAMDETSVSIVSRQRRKYN